MHKNIRYNKGFTLIELLVVIAIIGILSSIVLVSLSAARSKGYDANRFSELKQLQTALQTYYMDHGSYPSTNGVWWGNSPNGLNKQVWIPGLAPKYISVLPKDPVYTPSACGGWGGTYLYMSDGNDYKLLNHCPQNSSVTRTPKSSTFYDPNRPIWAWQTSSSPAARNGW